MRKHLLRALSFFIGGATCALVWHFFGEKLEHFVVQFQDPLLVLLRTFAWRRVQRPLWTFITLTLILRFLGRHRYGEWRRKLWQPIERCLGYWYRWWAVWPLAVRVIVVAVLCALLISAFWYTTYDLAVALSLTYVLEKVYYWIGDKFFDQWTRRLHLRFWLNRIVRRNALLWHLLRRPRHYKAVWLQFVETTRSERKIRRSMQKEWDAWFARKLAEDAMYHHERIKLIRDSY